jgi:hypothetical protein
MRCARPSTALCGVLSANAAPAATVPLSSTVLSLAAQGSSSREGLASFLVRTPTVHNPLPVGRQPLHRCFSTSAHVNQRENEVQDLEFAEDDDDGSVPRQVSRPPSSPLHYVRDQVNIFRDAAQARRRGGLAAGSTNNSVGGSRPAKPLDGRRLMEILKGLTKAYEHQAELALDKDSKVFPEKLVHSPAFEELTNHFNRAIIRFPERFPAWTLSGAAFEIIRPLTDLLPNQRHEYLSSEALTRFLMVCALAFQRQIPNATIINFCNIMIPMARAQTNPAAPRALRNIAAWLVSCEHKHILRARGTGNSGDSLLSRNTSSAPTPSYDAKAMAAWLIEASQTPAIHMKGNSSSSSSGVGGVGDGAAASTTSTTATDSVNNSGGGGGDDDALPSFKPAMMTIEESEASFAAMLEEEEGGGEGPWEETPRRPATPAAAPSLPSLSSSPPFWMPEEAKLAMESDLSQLANLADMTSVSPLQTAYDMPIELTRMIFALAPIMTQPIHYNVSSSGAPTADGTSTTSSVVGVTVPGAPTRLHEVLMECLLRRYLLGASKFPETLTLPDLSRVLRALADTGVSVRNNSDHRVTRAETNFVNLIGNRIASRRAKGSAGAYYKIKNVSAENKLIESYLVDMDLPSLVNVLVKVVTGWLKDGLAKESAVPQYRAQLERMGSRSSANGNTSTKNLTALLDALPPVVRPWLLLLEEEADDVLLDDGGGGRRRVGEAFEAVLQLATTKLQEKVVRSGNNNNHFASKMKPSEISVAYTSVKEMVLYSALSSSSSSPPLEKGDEAVTTVSPPEPRTALSLHLLPLLFAFKPEITHTAAATRTVSMKASTGTGALAPPTPKFQLQEVPTAKGGEKAGHSDDGTLERIERAGFSFLSASTDALPASIQLLAGPSVTTISSTISNKLNGIASIAAARTLLLAPAIRGNNTSTNAKNTGGGKNDSSKKNAAAAQQVVELDLSAGGSGGSGSENANDSAAAAGGGDPTHLCTSVLCNAAASSNNALTAQALCEGAWTIATEIACTNAQQMTSTNALAKLSSSGAASSKDPFNTVVVPFAGDSSAATTSTISSADNTSSSTSPIASSLIRLLDSATQSASFTLPLPYLVPLLWASSVGNVYHQPFLTAAAERLRGVVEEKEEKEKAEGNGGGSVIISAAGLPPAKVGPAHAASAPFSPRTLSLLQWAAATSTLGLQQQTRLSADGSSAGSLPLELIVRPLWGRILDLSVGLQQRQQQQQAATTSAAAINPLAVATLRIADKLNNGGSIISNEEVAATLPPEAARKRSKFHTQLHQVLAIVKENGDPNSRQSQSTLGGLIVPRLTVVPPPSALVRIQADALFDIQSSSSSSSSASALPVALLRYPATLPPSDILAAYHGHKGSSSSSSGEKIVTTTLPQAVLVSEASDFRWRCAALTALGYRVIAVDAQAFVSASSVVSKMDVLLKKAGL